VLLSEKALSLQVAQFDPISVDDTNATDTTANQPLGNH
jgi:hypothetical protein